MSRYKGNVEFLGIEEYTKKMRYIAEAAESEYPPNLNTILLLPLQFTLKFWNMSK